MNRLWVVALPLLLGFAACATGSDDTGLGGNGGGYGGATGVGGDSTSTGGISATGGYATGGFATGGAATGGMVGTGGETATGGDTSTGGVGTGGTNTGGTNTGGVSTGGTSTGGTNTGGFSTGGTNTGGTNTGGFSTGGTSTGGVSTGGTSTGGVSTGGTSTGGASTGGTGGTTGAKFHVFLLLGQSNMAGYPKAQTSDKVENARIKVLGYDDCAATGRKTNQWDTAAPPLHECWNGAIGPGDWFSKTLINVIPAADTIGLVPCAISGEKIETFMKVGGTKYTWIIQRAQMAQQAGGVIDGILFHQGESNCGDSTWPGKVKTLVTDLRTDLKTGNIPFLAGELVYTGACSQHNTLVNQLPGLITNAFVVSASGLALDPADTQWHLHFGHDAQVTFGQRYEAKMVQALGW